MFRDEHVTLLKQVALNLATDVHLVKRGPKRNTLERQKKRQPIETLYDQPWLLSGGVGVQDARAHPLLLSTSPRSSLACAAAVAGRGGSNRSFTCGWLNSY